jgi:hypothetical protein
LVGVRIFPLSKVPDNFYEGSTPNPEPMIKTGILKNAWTEAMEIAENLNIPATVCFYNE